MFGLGVEKLLFLAVVGFLLVGPERLPGFAAQAGTLARSLRLHIQQARAQLDHEIGPELAQLHISDLSARGLADRLLGAETMVDLHDSVRIDPPPHDAPTGAQTSPAGASAPFDPETT